MVSLSGFSFEITRYVVQEASSFQVDVHQRFGLTLFALRRIIYLNDTFGGSFLIFSTFFFMATKLGYVDFVIFSEAVEIKPSSLDGLDLSRRKFAEN